MEVILLWHWDSLPERRQRTGHPCRSTWEDQGVGLKCWILGSFDESWHWVRIVAQAALGHSGKKIIDTPKGVPSCIWDYIEWSSGWGVEIFERNHRRHSQREHLQVVWVIRTTFNEAGDQVVGAACEGARDSVAGGQVVGFSRPFRARYHIGEGYCHAEALGRFGLESSLHEVSGGAG